MNHITDLLDLEDTDVIISGIRIQGQTKTITLETPPTAHFCPSCGYRMHSRGIKRRAINHPILQDNYSLFLILKQRRWRCTNPVCPYDISESFKFVDKHRRTTNASDMLIVDAYRNLLETSASIAKRFHVSDSHAYEVFDRYIKLDRLPLTDAISIDEVHLDMDDDCQYALVIQDFHTGDTIDLLRSRRTNVTEPYFVSIPADERSQVKYLISDMYNPYIAYVEKYFPNAVPVVDSFHVIQWITRSINSYIRQLLKKYRQRDREYQDKLSLQRQRPVTLPPSDEVYLLQNPVINSFIMVEKMGNGKIYDARLSNGPIESLNRKVKDLRRIGYGFRNFEHFRNRFLYATRSSPVLNGISDHNPVTYFKDDDF